MKIDVSNGEAIDKYCILEIKMENIKDEEKLVHIRKELECLSECLPIIENNRFLYRLLKKVNKEIWDDTENLSLSMAERIFKNNERRYRIKNMFNEYSPLKEQKSKAKKICLVQNFTYSKISELNYLSLEYDIIYVKDLSNICFPQPTIKIWNGEEYNEIVDISLLTVEGYDFESIRYIGGGLLGDFINQLSVVKELFLLTGRKGIVYMIDLPNPLDRFKFGLEKACQDINSLFQKEDYIENIKIYGGEDVTINLSSWRSNHLIPRVNLYHINKDEYGIEWGTHPWLNLPKDPSMKDIIFLSIACYRYPDDIDFKALKDKFGDKLFYLTQDKESYYEFVKISGLELNCVLTQSLLDFAICINSCRLFVGNYSSPLTIALALHSPVLICSAWEGRPLNQGYTLHRNIYYSINDIPDINAQSNKDPVSDSTDR